MIMCVLAFANINVWLLLALLSPVNLVSVILAIETMRLFQRTTSVVVITCTYMFCFVVLMRMVTDNQAFKVSNPAVCDSLITLISYAAFAFCLLIVTLLGFVMKKMETQKKPNRVIKWQ
jgi:hypothetical protein